MGNAVHSPPGNVNKLTNGLFWTCEIELGIGYMGTGFVPKAIVGCEDPVKMEKRSSVTHREKGLLRAIHNVPPLLDLLNLPRNLWSKVEGSASWVPYGVRCLSPRFQPAPVPDLQKRKKKSMKSVVKCDTDSPRCHSKGG